MTIAFSFKRVFLVLAASSTITILILYECQKLKFCVFNFQGKGNKYHSQRIVRDANQRRAEVAQAYLNDYGGDLNMTRAGLMAITVITANRNKRADSYQPRYLTQVISRLVKLIREFRGVGLVSDLFVCNVEANVRSHEEAGNLSHIVTSWEKYPEPPEPRDMPESVFEKEKRDYIFCLNRTLQATAAKYLLVLQDDAVPRVEFLYVLSDVVSRHLERQESPGGSVAWVKLYHPERLLGYISLEVERIPELLGTGLVFGSLLALVCRHHLHTPSSHHLHSLVLVCCVVLVMAIAGVFSRQHALELRRLLPASLYWYGPAPDCCIPAVLYPRPSAHILLNRLRHVTCKPGFAIDTAMDHLIRNGSIPLARKMVQPNIVKHIGMYSTLRAKVLDPVIIDEDF